MIIGLSGDAGVGKDTFADVLVRDHGFVKIGLADPMKRFCREVFDFSESQLWGPSEMRNAPDTRFMREVKVHQACTIPHCAHAENSVDCEAGIYFEREGLTPRRALQTLGTEWGRACYENIWIDYALRVAADVVAGRSYNAIDGLTGERGRTVGHSVVIADCRFRNEFEAIRGVGGKLIRITRPNFYPRDAQAFRAHVSEQEAGTLDDDYFDAVYQNDGTIEEMREHVAFALRNKIGKDRT